MTGRAVTGLALRLVRRGATIVIVLAAGMVALVAATYRSTVGGAAGVASLDSLAGNPAIRTLFGEPAALDRAGGFTVWRTGTVLAVLLGMWGLLTATRITRGEEDAGRWDLLLSGRLPIGRVVGRHLAVLVAVMAVAGLAVAAGLTAAGTGPAGAALYGTGLAVLGMFFAGVGGFAAQVFATRGPATGVAAAVLVAGLLLRMIGDGVAALAWLRWVTPFGLLELSRPYDAGRWLPVAVLAAAAALVLAAAPTVAARRDLRGGRVAPETGREPRLGLLGSVTGFAVRRTLRPMAGWALAIGAYYLLIGLIAVSLTRFLADNPRFTELAARAGVAGLDTVEGAAATLFALLAVPAGVFAAMRVAALGADESARRLTLLYAGPLTRPRTASAEAAIAGAAAVMLVLVAGLATWAGAAIAGAGLPLPAALAGALNVLPVVALCLGAAVFALGVSPRAVAAVGAVPAVGGFLLRVVSESLPVPGWVTRMSPFAHLAPVPARPPDWIAAAVMTAIAVLLGLLGVSAYAARDLRG